MSKFKVQSPKSKSPNLEYLRFFLCLGILISPIPSIAQEINPEGFPIPNLEGLTPYSIGIELVDGVEKIVEKFHTPEGGHVARLRGNGRIFAYAVDHNQDPPIDYLLIDLEGLGRFTKKIGPEGSYLIPEWVSQ